MFRPSFLFRSHRLPAPGIASRSSCSCGASLPAWPSSSFPEPIDTTSHLTKIARYERHLLVDTSITAGAYDWLPYLPIGASSSVAAAIAACLEKEERFAFKKTKRKLLCNQIASDLHKIDVASQDRNDRASVLIMPDGVQAQIKPSEAAALLDMVLATTAQEQTLLPRLQQQHPAWSAERLPFSTLVFLCGHNQRDARCGLAAPVLQAHARHHLASEDVKHYYMDHMGGHKFAGNLVLYQQRAQDEAWHSAWYGRVHVDNIKEILDETLRKGNVVDANVRFTSGHSKKT